MSAFASWHVIGCHRDAGWVVLAGDGETVSRFLCDGCRQNEGRPVPAIADIWGKVGPVQCEDHPDRMHYLVAC